MQSVYENPFGVTLQGVEFMAFFVTQIPTKLVDVFQAV